MPRSMRLRTHNKFARTVWTVSVLLFVMSNLLLSGCRRVLIDNELMLLDGIHIEKRTQLPFSGTYIDYGDDQIPDHIFDLRDGRRDGLRIEYYPDGVVKQMDSYRDDSLEGPATFFYPDGQRRLDTYFKFGLEEGLREEWYPSGLRKSTTQMQEGKKHGFHRQWNEAGQPLPVELYENGKPSEPEQNLPLINDD